MNRTLTLAAVLAATAIAATGCDKPRTSTSYNNSGADATAAQPASSGSPTVSTTVTTTNTENQGDNAPAAATSSTATPDTASPNVASTAAPAGNTGGASGAVSETVTTGKIKAAIAADSAMKDSDVSVTTKDGVVTLAGTVKSQDQIAIATNLAQRQEGVQRVESNVTVR